MRNDIKTIIVLSSLGAIAISLFGVNILLIQERKEVLKEFKDNKIFDVNGNIILTELKKERDELKKEVDILYKENNIDENIYEKNISELKKENDNLVSEYQLQNEKIVELNKLKEALSSQHKVLNDKYQLVLKEREEEIRRNTVIINGVPTINQYPNYPTGCESVALAILLRYYGVNVSIDGIISNLKKGDDPYFENEIRYGGNPEMEFIGSPYSGESYGVYNNPIADVANIYKAGVTVRSGMPFSEVLNLVKNGHPVIAWTSMNLAVPYISNSWIYKPTGETINWKSQEHAVVIIGYNNDDVIISDPLRGNVRYQSKSVFESRYNYYGRRAVYY